MITMDRDELTENGYIEIISQTDDGEVVLKNTDGKLELFMVRDSYAGWCLDTEQGSVLEFIRRVKCKHID